MTAAGLTAAAVVLGWVTMSAPVRALRARPARAEPAARSARLQWMPQRFLHYLHVSPAWARSAPHRLFHYLYLSPVAMLRLARSLRSQFVLFLVIWLQSDATRLMEQLGAVPSSGQLAGGLEGPR